MLQQTRASVVVPYFLRWMEQFPDVAALARAPLDDVIKAWEGLGYYSRARNLHRGAQQIVADFGGEIPDSKEALATISGLGPYTVGAILSFGFHKRAAAIDGNVLRVMSRYLAIEENVCRSKVRRSIEERTTALLDEREPWITAEALIELGATVCLPRPRCGDCPLQASCLGLQKGIAESLPIKNGEKEITLLTRVVAVVESQGQFLVRKGERGKVMADLYEFPYFESEDGGEDRSELEKWLGFDVEYVRSLGEVSHTFTRYKARLFPFLLRAALPVPMAGATWVSQEQLTKLPFSAGHRRIVERLYCAQSDCVNLDSARQSQIEALCSDRRSPAPSGQGEKEDRLVVVLPSPNSHNLTGRSI
jgi:A/G-specific adenine glycosylase